MDDGKSELYRIIEEGKVLGQTEETIKSWCKRMNAFQTRNDFSSHFSYREVKDTKQSGVDGGTTA